MNNNLQLIDLRSGKTTKETFGTCDMCMSTGSHTPEFLVFNLGDETREYETGEWDWGDYIVDLDIDNVAEFAKFIADRKIDYFPDRHELQSLVYEHNYGDEDED